MLGGIYAGTITPPTIGTDGTIDVGSTDKNLCALTPSGKEKWRFIVEDILEASPSIDPDGSIYVGVIDMTEKDKHLYALNLDGTEKWRFQTGGVIMSPPSLDSKGNVYFGSGDHHLYVIDGDRASMEKKRVV